MFKAMPEYVGNDLMSHRYSSCCDSNSDIYVRFSFKDEPEVTAYLLLKKNELISVDYLCGEFSI
jgi:hypothetical protein